MDENALNADLRRVASEGQEASRIGAISLDLSRTSETSGLTAKLSSLMCQLHAMVGYPIKIQYNQLVNRMIPHQNPHLPVANASKLIRQCGYWTTILDGMPAHKRDPDDELLLNHFVDIRRIFDRQATAAAADFEDLNWDDEQYSEVVDEHVTSVVNLVNGLKVADAAGWQLVRSLKPLQLYAHRLCTEVPALCDAPSWFDHFWETLHHFQTRYGHFKMGAWQVPQKVASLFCDITTSQMERALYQHFTGGMHPGQVPAQTHSGGASEWLHRADQLFSLTARGAKKLVIGTALAPVVLAKETGKLGAKLVKNTGMLLRLSSEDDLLVPETVTSEEDEEAEDVSHDLQHLVSEWLAVLHSAVLFETQMSKTPQMQEQISSGEFDVGKISRLLMVYHQWYVKLEAQLMITFLEEVTSVPEVFDTVAAGILQGSSWLFEKIKHTMNRVRSMCPRNPEQCQEILRKLYMDVFHEALAVYANMLVECLDVVAEQHDALQAGMAVVNTANYCLELAPQLEGALQDGTLQENEALRDELVRVFIQVKHEASLKTVELAINGVTPILEMVKLVKTNKFPGPSVYVTNDLKSMIQQLQIMFANLSADDEVITVVKFVARVIRGYKSQILSCTHLSLSAIDQLLEDSFAIQNLLLTLASTGDSGDGIHATILTEMRKVFGILETMQSRPDNLVMCFANRVDNPDLRSERDFSKLLNAIGDLLNDDVKVYSLTLALCAL